MCSMARKAALSFGLFGLSDQSFRMVTNLFFSILINFCRVVDLYFVVDWYLLVVGTREN